MSARFLIVGKNGMLGHDLVSTFARRFGDDAILPLTHQDLDITSKERVFEVVKRHAPCVVINAAAYTNVDAAETERDKADLVNHRGPALLAQACHEFGARLVHFGTDQVFDGKTNHPRTEDETPNPLNNYATTKLLGEREVLKGQNHLVLRVQWLYGETKDRFTPLRDKKVFTPFSDQFGAPTWTKKVSETVLELVEKRATGLLHFAYDDWASWADVYAFVKEQMGLSVSLEPKLTADVKLPAARPLFSVLSNRNLCKALNRPGMGSWKEPLAEFLSLRLQSKS